MENKNVAQSMGKIDCPLMRWKIDYSKCTGCAECVDACTKHLLEMKNRRPVIIDETGCPQCGDCVLVCGSAAIILT